MTVSPALLRALDIARLAERHGDDPVEISLSMIAVGARTLTLIGGNAAAGATMHVWAVKITEGGRLAESLHAPGHA